MDMDNVFNAISMMFWLQIFAGFAAIIISILIKIYVAFCFYEIASEKGFDEKRYFWIPFLFGLVGYLMVIALPDRGAEYQINPVTSSHPDQDN